MKFSYGEGDLVRVRVTFPFKCNIPIVNRFMCETPMVWYGGEAGAGIEHGLRIAQAVEDGSLSLNDAVALGSNVGNTINGEALNALSNSRAQELQDRWMTARDRVNQPHYEDIRHYSRGWELMGAMLGLQGMAAAGLVGSTPRLMLVPAEAALPVQAAGFEYPTCSNGESEGGEGGDPGAGEGSGGGE